ncbi:hypothetical protein [Burkholderia pseudomallei]|uniref:hypothetical protein n=1 Tax=Burkholderia pseudomallei TaxID=28450 RepID=UPI000536C4EE|nr:hypothetical protein [Burkholderia pseudomallei]KGW81059.1 hypothetical protein Y048_4230 [Burkholderia pseudomallei MSHR456]OMW51422.1 hypothetical protein AQ810_10335 [Burkholderia pseudomallei]
MKISSTSIQTALYRVNFDLTADEIGRIAIGTPTRVWLRANSGEPTRALSRLRQDVSTTPCSVRTVLRTLD